jgi:hypothetical protein
MSLAQCCEKFLLDLHPTPEPPVQCETCGRRITFDRAKIQSTVIGDEWDAPPYIDEGFAPVNPSYINED